MNIQEMYLHDYRGGQKLQLFSIEPSSVVRGTDHSEPSGDQAEENYGRLGRCYLYNPPLPPAQKAPLEIILGQRLEGGIREHVSHVWTAHVIPDESTGLSEKMVVKFYDPLYYQDRDKNWRADPWESVFRNAKDECESYRRLRELPKDFIPKYHGVFLAALPVPSCPSPKGINPPKTRNVHAILMSFLPGTPLSKIDPGTMTPSRRDLIMDSVIDLYERAKANGVEHMDVEPRNFMLRNDEGDDDVQVWMYDFERVIFRPSYPLDISSEGRRQRIEKQREEGHNFYGESPWKSWMVHNVAQDNGPEQHTFYGKNSSGG